MSSTWQCLLDSEIVTMSRELRLISRFLVSEDGPTAVEYAVMLGLIVVAAVGIVNNLTSSVIGLFSTVSSTINSGS
jgi:pilus assembly protein Flp/PilA